MKISNELKRVRKKLKLFDQEAVNWLLSDLIELDDEINDDLVVKATEAQRKARIELLKLRYKQQEETLTPLGSKQQKLF